MKSKEVTLVRKRKAFNINPCEGCTLSVDGVNDCGHEGRINNEEDPLFCGEQLGATRWIWVVKS